MIEALNVTVEQTNLANYTDGPVTEVNTAPEVVSGTRFFDGRRLMNVLLVCMIVATDDEEIIKGTILIPCRTATRGKFPVNGAFFQINEVFADHESSELPVDVPKAWVCNLPKRSLHCAMTATTIFRDATSEEIQYCLSRVHVFLKAGKIQLSLCRLLEGCRSGQKTLESLEGASILLWTKYSHHRRRSHGPILIPDQGIQERGTKVSLRIGGLRT
ncbi:hypothetical protein POM88_006803 [Heracleum sosnowskyi]|uniref:Demeter RRM-fold domain-containing protein n=1 Tax=Heracleum sosnowskyi TaxID=360622 RepID=A0AAD8J713_9APIA|nr:hypothetical protein POM88_006803 [Heracleum sosnowskyi]